MKRLAPLIIGIVIVILVLVGITVLTRKATDGTLTGSSAKTAQIVTTVTPTDGTTIVINGDVVKEGKLQVEPGLYNVEVSHDGFETQKKTVTVKDGETSNVAIALASNTSATADWYTKHPEDAKKAEGIGSTDSRVTAESRIETLPFISRLPVRVPKQYTIDYGPSVKNPKNSSAVAIYISYNSDASKEAARNWIRYQGYDPDKLEVIYTANRAQ